MFDASSGGHTKHKIDCPATKQAAADHVGNGINTSSFNFKLKPIHDLEIISLDRVTHGQQSDHIRVPFFLLLRFGTLKTIMA